jgi:hypothetical protein
MDDVFDLEAMLAGDCDSEDEVASKPPDEKANIPDS